MNLYLLTTAGLGDFYVVEKCPTSAEKRLINLFIASDYGNPRRRLVTNIKVLSNELYNFPENKPNFSSGFNLILPSTCQ